MYADNLREAVRTVKETGFVHRPLCQMLIFWKQDSPNLAELYTRLMRAMQRLEMLYLINANR